MFERITRPQFLRWRHYQMQQAYAMKSHLGAENMIIVDAGDEVICDVCNANIDGDILWRSDWGLYCNECRLAVMKEG